MHHDNWMRDEEKAVSVLQNTEPEELFVCGSSRNRDDFLPYFTKAFYLRVDAHTMRQRLEATATRAIPKPTAPNPGVTIRRRVVVTASQDARCV